MPDQPLRFAPDFPVPDRAAWRAAVDQTLRGRDFESLTWAFDDGPPIEPLVTAEDVAELPHLSPAPRSWLRRPPGWAARELVVHPDPGVAADCIRAALGDGANEIELGLDQLVHDALEPGEHDVPGMSGIAVHGIDDMRALLAGVEDLSTTRIGISGGEGTLGAFAFALAVARERGVDPSALQLDLEFDPIARITQRQADLDPEQEPPLVRSLRTSPESVFDELASLVSSCRALGPGIRPVAVDGQISHLSGADAALELGFTLATLVEIARQLGQRGLSFDEFGPAATLRVQVSHQVLTEIAKLRALRLLWAKVAHACGATDPASLRPRVHGMTSGRSRAFRFDLRTNLLRTTLATFAAATGGCDSILVLPFDEDPANQDHSARRLARHQHQLLRDESMLAGAAADPAGGAFAIEALTDRIAAGAWRHLQAIEARGGLIQTMVDGSLHATHSDMVGTRTADFATRRRTLVGINRYVDPALEGPPTGDPEAWQRTLETRAAQIAKRAIRRDAAAARAALAQISPKADRLLDSITAAAVAGATTSEISQSSWPHQGTVFQHRFAPIAIPDGEEFEELRTAVQEEGESPRARLVLVDDSRVARQRAEFARSVFTAGGWHIEEPGAVTRGIPAATVLCAEGDGWTSALESAHDPVVVVSEPHYGHDVLFLHEGSDIIQLLVTLTGGYDDEDIS